MEMCIIKVECGDGWGYPSSYSLRSWQTDGCGRASAATRFLM